MSRKIAVIIPLLIGALLLGWNAWKSPVWYDDAGHYLVAKAWAETGEWCYPVVAEDGRITECIQGSPFITMGPALAWPGAMILKAFRGGMTSLRVFMVLLSLLVLCVFYGWTKALLNESKAFWATLIVVGNIQFVTYGAEFLGEIPMLGWLFAGLWMLKNWVVDGKGWANAVLALILLEMAILTKEYIAPVIGAGLFLGGLWLVLKGEKRMGLKTLLFSVLLGVFSLACLIIAYGGWQGFQSALAQRASYSEEFFLLSGEPWRFLVFKPFIWLGAIALIVKLRLRRSPVDILLAAVFAMQVLWFVISAGFDRFGFQLIYIPAIYLAEFAAFGWNWWAEKGRHKSLKRMLILAAILIPGWQQSLLRPLRATWSSAYAEQLNLENLREKQVAALLDQEKVQTIFTYDQQIMPFIHTPNWQLEKVVPSNASLCQTFYPEKANLGLVLGIYGLSDYGSCHNMLSWEPGTRMLEVNKSYEIHITQPADL